MCHLLQTSAFLRWSAIRFRHCEGQFRYLTLPCAAAFPRFSHHVAANSNLDSGNQGTRATRAVLFEPLVASFEQREGCVPGFRSFRSRSSHFQQIACAYEDLGSKGENFDADSDDDEEEEDDGRVYQAGDDYIVVNFYHFVDIEDAHLEVARHTAFMEVRQFRFS